MPVLSSFQPGPAVDPARALNVFTSLQESRKRNELLEQQTQNVAQQMAFEAELQPTRKAAQIAQLGAAENQLKSARIAADQAVLQEKRLSGLRDSWDPESFQSEFDDIKDEPSVLARREKLAALTSKWGRYADIPEAQSFMAPLISQYGAGLEEEFKHAISTSNLEVFPDRASAQEVASGRYIRQTTNPYTGGPTYVVEDRPDPTLDSTATTRIRQAMAVGTPEAINKALEDDAVSLMLGVPNSTAGKAYQSAVAKLQELAAAEKKSDTEISQHRTKTEIDIASKNVDELLKGSGAVGQSLGGVNRALELLETVKTGFGAETIAAIKGIAASFGVDSDVSSVQELQTLFGDQIMARVGQTKGAVSEKEMDLFQQFSPNLGKTPKANKAILTTLQKVLERDMAVRAYAANLKRTGTPIEQIGDLVEQKRIELLNGEKPFGFSGDTAKTDIERRDEELARRGLRIPGRS